MPSIDLIVAPKGHGKTAKLLNSIREASQNSKGSVVFLRQKFDADMNLSIPFKVRVIDAEDYPCFYQSFRSLFAFICGVLSQNRDITHLFVDGTLRICYPEGDGKEHIDELAKELLYPLGKIANKYKVDVTLTISCPPELLNR